MMSKDRVLPCNKLRKHPFPTHIPFTQTRLRAEAERVQELGLTQVEYSCTNDRGLRAVIYASGRIDLYSRCSYCHRPIRLKLGELGLVTLEQARQQHRAYRLQATQGEDPRAPRLAALLYRDLHEAHYIVQCRSRKKKSLHTDVSRYRNWLGPEFGAVPVSAITPTHINKFVLKMQEAGLAPATIKTTVGQLRTTLALAVELNIVPRNVASGIRLPKVNNRRTEFLTVDQIKAFLVAARACDPDQLVGSRLLMLLALTGARLGEALVAEWSHINLDAGIWHLPTQKSGRPGTIHLSEAAKTVLQEMAGVRCNDYVFPGLRGNVHLARPIRLFRRLCKVAGIPTTFRIHDIRHAWCSAGVHAGIPLEIVSQGARHSSPVVTRIYSHAHEEALRATQATIANLFMPAAA